MSNTLGDLAKKTKDTLKEEGFKPLMVKTRGYLNYQIRNAVSKSKKTYKDVLFINGCELPHPQRYRVDHQVEQLEAYGYSADKIYYGELTEEHLKFYRSFVFFRCPITSEVSSFIDKAHYFNKTCFFDIDDLVINRKYTDTIPFVAAMNKSDKAVYDDGVIRMEKTLKKCDFLITSTPALARELKKNYKKDVLVNKNVASEKMAELSFKALKEKRGYRNKFVIGYLSGSITHNPDFELIKAPLLKIMSEFPNVYLEISGLLDVPKEFEKFRERIIQKKFTDWQYLPKAISEIDLNLAPLEKSIFNEAKSENKWTEAALVKTVTLASDFGIFKDVIKDGKTGLLANSESEWYEKIKFAITNPEKIHSIASAAYDLAKAKYITTYSGLPLSKYIGEKCSHNIGFVLPTTNISGGVNVAIKHCNILRNNGYDVTIINMDKPSENIKNVDGEINVVSSVAYNFSGHFDSLVATLYSTLDFVKKYPDVREQIYLVQNFETNFAKFGSHAKSEANSTYNSFTDIRYITISKWCEDWLKDYFEKSALYAPNGIDVNRFKFNERKMTGKIKVLVEGNSHDYYKNVDESFKIVQKLDPAKFEIAYLSYEGEPKRWYRIDRFLHKVPTDEVHKVYESADILIKSSLLESFSYPPLEMMATGGFCVVRPNEGNVEYLENEKNCLFYDPDNLDTAVEQINRLIKDKALRAKLSKGAKQTVASRDWKKIEPQVVNLYKENDAKI